jgi:hypothetical protein
VAVDEGVDRGAAFDLDLRIEPFGEHARGGGLERGHHQRVEVAREDVKPPHTVSLPGCPSPGSNAGYSEPTLTGWGVDEIAHAPQVKITITAEK